MPLKLTKAAPKAEVTKQVTNNKTGETMSESHTQEEVQLPEKHQNVEGTPCVVGVEGSYTHNLGNYNSCKVGVSISIPCKHSEIDEVFELAKSWMDDRLNGMIEEVTATPDA